MSKELINQVN